MKIIAKYIRMDEWLTSKVTMMLGILVYFISRKHIEIERIAISLACYFIFLCMFLAVSYVVNDFADIKVDLLAGKKKLIADMPKWKIWLSFVFMFLAGNIPIIGCSNCKTVCAVIVLAIYLLGIAYSAPGIRLKERGILGVIECSFAQRSMPLVLIMFLVDFNKFDFFLLIGWMVLSFVDGLRYILIHQMLDIENDKKSGVKTYVSHKKGNYRSLIKMALVIEVAIGLAIMMPVFIEYPIIILIGMVVDIVLEYSIYVVLCKYAKKDWLVTFDSVPMEAYWNIIMPFFMGLCLVKYNILFVLFSVCIIVICKKPLMIKYNIAKMFMFRNS